MAKEESEIPIVLYTRMVAQLLNQNENDTDRLALQFMGTQSIFYEMIVGSPAAAMETRNMS